VALAGLFAAPLPGLAATAPCEIGRLLELPVTMIDMAPVISAGIDDSEVRLVADSGAFYSILSASSAAELKLSLTPAPFTFRLEGIAGDTSVAVTTVRQFTLGNAHIPRVQFIVGGSEPGSGAIGYLGQNVLGIADVEYDLANGVIRLMRPKHCEHAEMAYWAGVNAYEMIEIDSRSATSPQTSGSADLNGTRIRVIFDTGANTSMLSRRAAAKAGITPASPGVVEGGSVRGIGRGVVRTWIAPFRSFKLGSEEVRNTHLRFGDIEIAGADMLIGADFFLSHRLYVANSQRKLYFTYNGGPVFNLSVPTLASAAAAPATAAAPAAAPSAAESAAEPSAEPATDAAGYGRRGVAYAARRDYSRAIADLTRACELEPDNANWFYQRGLAHWKNKQPFLAMADLDRALTLQPDNLDALVGRAELRLSGGDAAGAASDLDVAALDASQGADLRLLIAQLYARADRFPAALAQLDQWIGSHDHDAKLAGALNDRCWLRTMSNQHLEQAQSDCNAALRLNPGMANALDSRGFLWLRQGKYDKSIADFDAALKIAPKGAWSLYGRGIDELRIGKLSEGKADIDAAIALLPDIAAQASRYGIAPRDPATQ
jgi:tetratricopeptide (TPR) repeat protein/predicted aspartyl protease